jgi:hypothetical protein
MTRNKPRSLLFTLILIIGLPLSNVEALADRPAPVTPETRTIWAAEMTVTILSSSGHRFSSSGQLRAHGPKIRFEPGGSEEINLYDFEKLEAVRLFPNDKIYFESRLSPARIAKGVKEGWTPAPAAYSEKKIFLREGNVKERAARLFLIILEENKRKSYSLRWVTPDEEARPLQIIYPASDYETVIIDYDPLRPEEYDPSQFEPPPGFLSVNPF